jgi:hypothetical protein
MVWIFPSEQKLTGGTSFTMQFPMATVNKNALYITVNDKTKGKIPIKEIF